MRTHILFAAVMTLPLRLAFVVFPPKLVNRQQIRMIESAGGTRFLLEPAPTDRDEKQTRR